VQQVLLGQKLVQLGLVHPADNGLFLLPVADALGKPAPEHDYSYRVPMSGHDYSYRASASLDHPPTGGLLRWVRPGKLAGHREGLADSRGIGSRCDQQLKQDARLERVQVASTNEPARQQVAF
jgi:hypothetical protein